MLLLTAKQKSKFILVFLYLYKQRWSVLNKDQNHWYYNIFLEKSSYQLDKE